MGPLLKLYVSVILSLENRYIVEIFLRQRNGPIKERSTGIKINNLKHVDISEESLKNHKGDLERTY